VLQVKGATEGRERGRESGNRWNAWSLSQEKKMEGGKHKVGLDNSDEDMLGHVKLDIFSFLLYYYTGGTL
jgi:hypothetical protein